jgi:hypothetical protein
LSENGSITNTLLCTIAWPTWLSLDPRID